MFHSHCNITTDFARLKHCWLNWLSFELYFLIFKAKCYNTFQVSLSIWPNSECVTFPVIAKLMKKSVCWPVGATRVDRFWEGWRSRVSLRHLDANTSLSLVNTCCQAALHPFGDDVWKWRGFPWSYNKKLLLKNFFMSGLDLVLNFKMILCRK